MPLVTTYDYDMFGPYQITRPDGSVITIVKDGRGRPRYVTTPDGVRERRYHADTSPRLDILPSGVALRYGYDSMGRLNLVERLSSDPEASGSTAVLGWSEAYTYDVAGNVVHKERRDAQGAVTWQQDGSFDVQHRPVSAPHPELQNASRKNEFDPSGFLSLFTDEQGRSIGFTPDGLNRVKKVTRAGWDANGSPVSLDVAQYLYCTRTRWAVAKWGIHAGRAIVTDRVQA